MLRLKIHGALQPALPVIQVPRYSPTGRCMTEGLIKAYHPIKLAGLWILSALSLGWIGHINQ